MHAMTNFTYENQKYLFVDGTFALDVHRTFLNALLEDFLNEDTDTTT